MRDTITDLHCLEEYPPTLEPISTQQHPTPVRCIKICALVMSKTHCTGKYDHMDIGMFKDQGTGGEMKTGLRVYWCCDW